MADVGAEKLSVGILTGKETAGEWDDALKKLGWKSRKYSDDEEGWQMLEKSLNQHRLLVATSGNRNLLPRNETPEASKRAAQLHSFMENGGVLILNGVTTKEPLEWLPLLDPGFAVSAVIPAKIPQDAAVHNPNPANTLRSYPVPISDTEQPTHGLAFKNGKQWESVAQWAGHSCMAIKRFGKGFLLLSTLRHTDETLLKNTAAMLRFQGMGLYYGTTKFIFENHAQFPDIENIAPGRGIARVALRNVSGEPVTAKAVFRLKNDQESREIFHTLPNIAVNKWGTLDIPMTADLRGKTAISVALVDPKDQSEIPLFMGEAELPRFLTVIPPAYRGMISTARRDKNVHFQIRFVPLHEKIEGAPLRLKITDANGKTISEKEMTILTPEFPVVMELPADAPEGEYRITATTLKQGALEETATGNFKIVPVREGQVFVDQDTVLLKEGKPFFPIGIYHVTDKQIDEIADFGFNIIQFWSQYTTPESLDYLHSKGILALWEGHAWGKAAHIPSWRSPETHPAVLKELENQREAAAKYRKHPALGMWYVGDEPPVGKLPVLRKINQTWHSSDEDHPTYFVATGNYDRLHEAADIMAIDPYSVYRGKRNPLPRIANETDEALEAVQYRKPIIAIPQSFGHNKQHDEKPEEVRAMTYLHLVRGVKGVIWYCWKETGDVTGVEGVGHHPETQKELKEMIAEIKQIAPALMEPGSRMLKSRDGKVYALIAGSEQTGRYLVYVNSDYTASDAIMHVPELSGKKLKGHFGAAGATVKGDTLKIKVPPLATGILAIQ